MNSPNFRTEKTDNPKSRGRQPTITENSVGLRILSVLGQRPRSWLAQASGQPESTIGDAIKRGPARSDVAIKIADALGVSLDWLLLDGAESDSGEPTSAGRAARAIDDDDDLVDVQEIDLAYGLGATFANDPVSIQTRRFPRAWIEAITMTSPALLTFARCRGDSMQPTIQDGDMVLIDRSERSVREWDAVWALTIGDMAMVKRVRVRGEQVHILSDNDRVPSEQVFHEEINVVGRVIFIGRKI